MRSAMFRGSFAHRSVPGGASHGDRAMKLKLWQVDAFAAKPLEGNPAAIVPLERWLDAGLMQKIANENNLAETAFFVRIANGRYELRWFTPESEVDLCGHATLASAWLIFDRLDPDLKSIALLHRLRREVRPGDQARSPEDAGPGDRPGGERGAEALQLHRRREDVRAGRQLRRP